MERGFKRRGRKIIVTLVAILAILLFIFFRSLNSITDVRTTAVEETPVEQEKATIINKAPQYATTNPESTESNGDILIQEDNNNSTANTNYTSTPSNNSSETTPDQPTVVDNPSEPSLVDVVLSQITSQKAPVISSKSTSSKVFTFVIEAELTPSSQNSGHIQEILSILGQYGKKATFSVTNNYAEKYGYLVDQMLAGGHEVIVSNNDGLGLTNMSTEDKILAIDESFRTINSNYFIPQARMYDDETLQILQVYGKKMVMPNIEFKVWQKFLSMNPVDSSQFDIRKEYEQIQPGSICLMTATNEACDDFIDSFIWFVEQDYLGYTHQNISQR